MFENQSDLVQSRAEMPTPDMGIGRMKTPYVDHLTTGCHNPWHVNINGRIRAECTGTFAGGQDHDRTQQSNQREQQTC